MRNSGFDSWNGTVEYSHQVLEAVRAEAANGLTALAHGGLEVGGVLYGERRAGITRILSSAPLECEHAYGPGFVLSVNDAAHFRELLKPREGHRAVGWYCSHTRSGLALSSNDCAILEQFFPDGGSVALVVKPLRSGPAEATFYLQGKAEPGPHFSILVGPAKPLESRVPSPRPVAARPSPAPAQTVAPLAPIAPVAPSPVTAAAAEAPKAAFAAWIPAQVAAFGRGLNLPRFPLDRIHFDRIDLSRVNVDMPQLRSAGAGLGMVALAMISLSLLTGKKVESANSRLGLQVYPLLGRQMRIEWDRKASAVRAGKTATLEIAEGSARRVLPLDADQLHASTLTYQSRTGSIEVRMKIANGPEESARFVARSPERTETPPSPEPVAARLDAAPRLPQIQAQPQQQPQMVQQPAPAQPQATEAQSDPDPAPQPVRLRRFELQEPARPAPAVLANLALPDPPVAAVPGVPGGVVKLGLPLPAPAIRPHAGPRSGRLIWTGQLQRRGVVEIEGSTATIGSLSGALPGVPVTLRVLPAKFNQDVLVVYSNEASRNNTGEAPGPMTGWNRLRYVWDPEEIKRISVLEAPRADNQFARLALRNEGKPCEVLVVEWRVN